MISFQVTLLRLGLALMLGALGEKRTVEIICHASDDAKLATVIETLHTVSGVRSVEASLRP